jgi:hypothetical protein
MDSFSARRAFSKLVWCMVVAISACGNSSQSPLADGAAGHQMSAAGAGGSTAGEGAGGGTAGTSAGAGTAGTDASAGTTGAGGTGAPSFAYVDASPGTVSVHLVVPAEAGPFCDVVPPVCNDVQHHFTILTSDRRQLALDPNVACAAPACGGEAPHCTPPPPAAFSSSDLKFDGAFYPDLRVDGSGRTTCLACPSTKYAAPGRYIARLCATPGTFAEADGGAPSCHPTGAEVCVEVPFDFPGPAVTITLPARGADGGAG